MMTVAELNELDRIDELRQLWAELWAQTPNASFSMRWDWLKTYWLHFFLGQKPKVLVVSLASRPIGIVPLVVKLVPSRFGWVRALTYPADSWAAFFGPVGKCSAATLHAALKHVAETRRDWDMVDFRYVDTEVTDAGRTANAFRSAGLKPVCRQWLFTPQLRLQEREERGWWPQAVPAACRERWQEAEFLLSQIGDVRWERWRPSGLVKGETDRRWTLFEYCLTKTVDAGKLTAERAALLRDFHPLAVDSGLADVSVLWLNEVPVAWSYGFQQNGRVELVLATGFGRTAVPATRALLGRLIQDGVAREDQELLWGPLCSDEGRPWTETGRWSYRYTYFAKSGLNGQALRVGYGLKRLLHAEAGPAHPHIRGRADGRSPASSTEPASQAATQNFSTDPKPQEAPVVLKFRR